MQTCSLETATTGEGKTEEMGPITCGKGVQTLAEVGECSKKKGQDAPSTEEPMFLRIRREINRVAHSNVATPDFEAEIVKRALDTCCTVSLRKARTLRLLAEILALVEQKQRFLQRWRGARRLCEKEQLSRQIKSQTAAVKGGSARIQEKQLEHLAGELEVTSTCAMVKRLAPVQAPPKVTVRQKDGAPTWGHDGEIAARDALVTIFGAEPLSLEAEPQLPQAKKCIPPETPVTYSNGH